MASKRVVLSRHVKITKGSDENKAKVQSPRLVMMSADATTEKMEVVGAKCVKMAANVDEVPSLN